ncbi:hypothetical protein YQE_06300, partial [Dendroctonus ponderosae]
MHFGRNYTKSEVILSEITMIYWSNFARTGNPNEQPEGDHARQERGRVKNVEWTAYEAVHKKYLNLDQKPKLKNHYRAHRLSFWLNLVPDLHKPGGDDVPSSHHELVDDDEPPPRLPSLNPRKLPTTETPTDFKNLFGNGSVLATAGAADSTERVEELGVKGDPATILGHHHSHHQLPPPEFADLPQNNSTLPRHAPPPGKVNKSNVNTLSSRNVQENQPLLSAHSIQLITTGTLTKKNTQLNAKQNTTMEELRV